MANGRTSTGRLKKGYRLTKGGRVVKRTSSRRRRRAGGRFAPVI